MTLFRRMRIEFSASHPERLKRNAKIQKILFILSELRIKSHTRASYYPMILVDTHVHIYDCYNIREFMNYSLSNFKHNAEKMQGKNSFSAFLLLAESRQYNWFSRLQAYAQHDDSQGISELGDWEINLTDNKGTLRAVNKNGKGFFIVAGRQIVTREHLELLALLTTEQFKDGEPMESVLENIFSKDAIPVIPWGAGKWIGKRGTFLKHFLTHAAPSILCLGDTGSRPSFWGTPYPFKIAAKNGIRVVAGTDPLPIVSDVCRPGSYGSMIFEKLNETTPSVHLKQLLRDSKTKIANYGELENPIRFLRRQLTLRLKGMKTNQK